MKKSFCIRTKYLRAFRVAAILLRVAPLVALLGYVGKPESAVAKDLKAVADFVIPAYTAMNFTTICAQDDPHFLSQTSGPRGNALQYAEHVKNEAIASLTYEEAVMVLQMAASEARTAARRELRKLAPDYPKAHPGEVTDWCRNEASRFVRESIEKHDGQHATILQELERSKQ
jgi:hypothetical protein